MVLFIDSNEKIYPIISDELTTNSYERVLTQRGLPKNAFAYKHRNI